MKHVSCPTSIVNAPVGVVWKLLMHPERWGDFYDMRITAVEPAGRAVVGQTVFAECGPRILHLKVQFQFLEIDSVNYRFRVDGRFPLGITVREDLRCVGMGPDQCRVNYNCNFGFPAGWRGALVHFLMRRELDAGPQDSIARLQRAAERCRYNSRKLTSMVALTRTGLPLRTPGRKRQR